MGPVERAVHWSLHLVDPFKTPSLAMRRFRASLLSVVVAVGLLFAAGCDSAGSPGVNDSESGGIMQMYLTDAPGDILKAKVIIESVSIVPVEDSSEGGSTNAGISVLSEEDFEVDLTKLQGGVDTLMAELEIDSGTYGQVRLKTANPEDFSVEDSFVKRGNTGEYNFKPTVKATVDTSASGN